MSLVELMISITLGMIGVGNMGSGHVQNFSNHCSIAAIADAYLPNAEKNVKWLHDNKRIPAGGKIDTYQDYRKLLERDDNDAVIIASPLHWHARHAIHAAQAGKHIYCEKPIAVDTPTALELHQLCKVAGVKNGVVQDKLWLASFVKLKRLIDTGFFGKILSVRGEFGYWVFEGHTIPAQRPSWNYRKEDDGGIIVDMLCHWQYVLENLFGKPKALSCLGATHITERIDENGKAYRCTADDAAYATFELEGGVVAHFNSSWVTRVRRDDLLTVQVDGEKGSAVCGLRDVWIQHYGNTPRPTWNPDIPQPINFYEGWAKVPDQETHDNAFKIQWELFLKHIVRDEPFPWDLLSGAKGVQFAELGIQSWKERRWLDVPTLA
jgi:predicted dehydrogenase